MATKQVVVLATELAAGLITADAISEAYGDDILTEVIAIGVGVGAGAIAGELIGDVYDSVADTFDIF